MIMQADALGRRPWTMKEVLWMCANYAELGPDACAKVLGRTPAAVVLQAMAHGASKRKVTAADVEESIRTLHAQGNSDEEIAAVLGWTGYGRERVRYWRHKFGLPPVPSKSRSHGSRGARAACVNNGTKTLVDVRWQAERVEAARRGWFGASNLAQVETLEVLRDGPLTCRQIIDRQGRRFTVGAYHRIRRHLAHLIGVGLVESKRASQVVYSLAYQACEEDGGDS